MRHGVQLCVLGHIGQAVGIVIRERHGMPAWCQGPWPEGILTPLGNNSAITLALNDRNDSPDNIFREVDLARTARLIDIDLRFCQ